MSPKKKSAYTVPKLKDFSAAALERAAKELLSALASESKAVDGEAEWKIFRDRWMARKNGFLTQINEPWLKAAPKDAKRDAGQCVNELKARVEEIVGATSERILSEARSKGRPVGRAQTRDSALILAGENPPPSVSTSRCLAFAVRSARSIPSSKR